MKKVLIAAAFSASLSGCWPASSCVARGSLVLTPGGWRPVEDLEVGDLVYAFDEDTGERFATPVTAIKRAMREVGSVALEGTTLRMTSDHPVYCPVDDLYAPAGDWFLGRRTELAVLSESGFRAVAVERARTFVEVSEVFDIAVEHERHNFVANGILVHNKDIACGDEGDACPCPDGSIGTSYCGECDCPTAPDAASDAQVDQGAQPDVSTDTGAPDTGTPDAAEPDMGDARHWGSCVTSADCADPAWSCITIPADEPNGYHTCQAAEAAEPGCGAIEPPDTCCVHADCNQADPGGTCVTGPIFYCGGVQPIIANVCLFDECATDGDCETDELCLPPRVLGEPVARCVSAQCSSDADCTASAGGQCREFFDPCNRRLTGFFCTYDDSVCRADADCPNDPMNPGMPFCAPGSGDGDTACDSFLPPP